MKQKSVSQWWTKFRDDINQILEDNVPSKMTKSKFTNPWTNTKKKIKYVNNKERHLIKRKRPVRRNKRIKLQQKEKLEKPKVIICKQMKNLNLADNTLKVKIEKQTHQEYHPLR